MFVIFCASYFRYEPGEKRQFCLGYEVLSYIQSEQDVLDPGLKIFGTSALSEASIALPTSTCVLDSVSINILDDSGNLLFYIAFSVVETAPF